MLEGGSRGAQDWGTFSPFKGEGDILLNGEQKSKVGKLKLPGKDGGREVKASRGRKTHEEKGKGRLHTTFEYTTKFRMKRTPQSQGGRRVAKQKERVLELAIRTCKAPPGLIRAEQHKKAGVSQSRNQNRHKAKLFRLLPDIRSGEELNRQPLTLTIPSKKKKNREKSRIPTQGRGNSCGQPLKKHTYGGKKGIFQRGAQVRQIKGGERKKGLGGRVTTNFQLYLMRSKGEESLSTEPRVGN